MRKYYNRRTSTVFEMVQVIIALRSFCFTQKRMRILIVYPRSKEEPAMGMMLSLFDQYRYSYFFYSFDYTSMFANYLEDVIVG